MPTITPRLWFDTQALEAAELYVSVFPGSEITSVTRYGPDMPGPLQEGDVLTVELTLDGTPFTALNGGPQFTFSEAVSFQISCRDQAETDHYWDSLVAGGGQESQCGWLKDRFGLSWQIVPALLTTLLHDPEPAKSARVMQAMLQMVKLDIAALQRAHQQG